MNDERPTLEQFLDGCGGSVDTFTHILRDSLLFELNDERTHRIVTQRLCDFLSAIDPGRSWYVSIMNSQCPLVLDGVRPLIFEVVSVHGDTGVVDVYMFDFLATSTR